MLQHIIANRDVYLIKFSRIPMKISRHALNVNFNRLLIVFNDQYLFSILCVHCPSKHEKMIYIQTNNRILTFVNKFSLSFSGKNRLSNKDILYR